MLRPPEVDAAADVRLEYEHPVREREAYGTICRFLSVLSWRHRRPASAMIRHSINSPTMRLDRMSHDPPLEKHFQFRESEQPKLDAKARIALALYREAMSTESIPYKFLGYFKILNVLHGKGSQQILWINKTLSLLSDSRSRERISILEKSQSDIGRYLYESGRCAVAHASVEPIVDPDDANDLFRLSADLPLVRALAEYLIETELEVERGRP